MPVFGEEDGRAIARKGRSSLAVSYRDGHKADTPLRLGFSSA
jgi:hypothetical protein